MGEQTKIAWTDSTWSPWRGCTHATLPDGSEHSGCQHCYAEAMAKRNPKVLGAWGPRGVRVRAKSCEPIKAWNAAAEKEGVRRFVFPSMCDPFEDFPAIVTDHRGSQLWIDLHSRQIAALGEFGEPPIRPRHLTFDYLRQEFFRLIDDTPNLTWLLLTKRPQNVVHMWPYDSASPQVPFPGFPGAMGKPQQCLQQQRRENVWLLASVSDQATADAMIPGLFKCRHLVPVLGLSIEPLLGPIDLSTLAIREGLEYGLRDKLIDWVIIGGESGPHSRPCSVEWIRDLVRQCREAHVPCFVKQLGSQPISPGEVGFVRHLMLSDRKGGDLAEWPEDLRVREMPEIGGATV